MPSITVTGTTPLQLAKYLTISLKQRERAVTKFIQDYGPNSATVAEITAEVATLRKIINELESPPLPLPEPDELIKKAK